MLRSKRRNMSISRIDNLIRFGEGAIPTTDCTWAGKRRSQAWEEIKKRSVFAKGFQVIAEDVPQPLEAFFKRYGETKQIRLKQIGPANTVTAFVEYANVESRNAFLDDAPMWNNRELLSLSGEDYFELIAKERHYRARVAVVERRGYVRSRRHRSETKFEMKTLAKSVFKGIPPEFACFERWKCVHNKTCEVLVRFKLLDKEIAVYKPDDEDPFLEEESIPYIKSATLMFESCDGNVLIEDIRNTMKLLYKLEDRPFSKSIENGSAGLIGFKRALSKTDVICISEVLKVRIGLKLTWSIPNEETERKFQLEWVRILALQVLKFKGLYRPEYEDVFKTKSATGGDADMMDIDSDQDAVSQTPVCATLTATPCGKAEKRKRDDEEDGRDDTEILRQALSGVRITKKARTEAESVENVILM